MIKIITNSGYVLLDTSFYTSMIYTEKFYDLGSFEIHIPLSTFNYSNDILGDYRLLNNSFIYLYANSTPSDADFIGVISKTVLNFNEIVLYGNDLKHILKLRIINGIKTGTLGSIINLYMGEAFPVDTNRAIPNYNATMYYQAVNNPTGYWDISGFSNLWDEFKLISNVYNINYKFTNIEDNIYSYVVDSDSILLTRPIIPFTQNLGNLKSREWTYDELDYINTLSVYNETTGLYTTYVNEDEGTTSGIQRKEMFLSTTTAKLTQDINTIFEENRKYESFNIEIDNRYFYDLIVGQTITLNISDDHWAEFVITEITRTIEGNKREISIIVGKAKPNIIKQLLRGGN